MNLDDAQVRQQIVEHGPVGAWTAVAGSHNVLGTDSVAFHADGTGELRLSSTVLGESHELFGFHWTLPEPGVLSCLFVADEYERADDEDEDPDWHRIAFTLEQRSTDVAAFWVMREVGRDGFWTLLDPVMPA